MRPTVDPCPVDVEVRLPPDGRFVFVSDLHLTEGGHTNDFGASAELCELVRSLCGHPGPVVLALGGDVLDLLQVDAPQERQAAAVLRGRDAQALGEALHELAARERPTTIVYLVGNHDSTIAWDGAGRALAARQLATGHVAIHLLLRVEGAGGGEVCVVAEHGDALDPYNRRRDPFDPLDVPIGDHMVTQVVNRLERSVDAHPELSLDEVDNVRPALMVPWWLVSNFFYRFTGQALLRLALPVLLLYAVIHLLVGTLVTTDFYRLAVLGNKFAWWLATVVLTLIALVVVLSTFFGRSFKSAAAAYGVPSPDEAEEEISARRRKIPALLDARAADATVLVSGHTHEPGLLPLPDGRLAVDAGCWVRGLVPVRAWVALPPVFVPSYPVNWVEVRAVPAGVEVSLWQRRLAVRRRLGPVEWLAARRPLPPGTAEPPHVVASTVLEPRLAGVPRPHAGPSGREVPAGDSPGSGTTHRSGDAHRGPGTVRRDARWTGNRIGDARRD